MTPLPYRERLYACIHPETYKYFFQKDRVALVWQTLAGRYGAIVRNEAFRIMQIEGDRFLFRSTHLANPITVIRKRGCTSAHVDELHAILGYAGE